MSNNTRLILSMLGNVFIVGISIHSFVKLLVHAWIVIDDENKDTEHYTKILIILSIRFVVVFVVSILPFSPMLTKILWM